MKTKTEITVQKFTDGYNCAQSVLYSFCDDFNINKDIALKMATGFGAGMGRKGEVCGAISGGILAIGLKYGRGAKEDRSAMELSYKKIQYLIDQFVEKNGTFICRQLLNGCDLSTKEGQSYFKDNDLLRRICIPCVQAVVEILEAIL